MAESHRRLAKMMMNNGPSKRKGSGAFIANVTSVDPISIKPSGTTISFFDEDLIWTSTAEAVKASLQENDSVLTYRLDDIYIVIDKIEK